MSLHWTQEIWHTWRLEPLASLPVQKCSLGSWSLIPSALLHLCPCFIISFVVDCGHLCFFQSPSFFSSALAVQWSEYSFYSPDLTIPSPFLELFNGFSFLKESNPNYFTWHSLFLSVYLQPHFICSWLRSSLLFPVSIISPPCISCSVVRILFVEPRFDCSIPIPGTLLWLLIP